MYLDAITLRTGHLPDMTRFYGKVLGLPVRQAPNGIVVTVARTELAFAFDEAVRGKSYHVAFNIAENRLDEAQAWLTARGVPILHDRVYPFDSWNAHAVYFADPAGNLLELIARHNLPPPPPGSRPVGPAHLLCVSEVALVSDDVPALAAEIGRVTGVGAYRPGDAQFTAVGDEEGLFILAARGREWFPETGISAEPLPLSVDARTADGTPFSVHGPPYRVERQGGGRTSPSTGEGND